MEAKTLELILVHIPNYFGLALALWLAWRVIRHEWDDDDK